MSNIKSSKKKSNKPLSITVITASIVIGLLVFFVSNSIFDKEKSLTSVSSSMTIKKLNLNNSNVKELYNYIKYREIGDSVPKLKKEQTVTIDSFSNYEKYYYAFQFIKINDLEIIDSSSYSIAGNKIKKYMKKFFGNKINYSTNCEFEYTFNFVINNMNTALISYDNKTDNFILKFIRNNDEVKLVDYYYSKLESAYLKGDKSIELDEKVIYIDTTVGTVSYNFSVYKDYFHTILLDKKENISLYGDIVNIDKYGENTAIIKYIFERDDNNKYYFKSSTIIN